MGLDIEAGPKIWEKKQLGSGKTLEDFGGDEDAYNSYYDFWYDQNISANENCVFHCSYGCFHSVRNLIEEETDEFLGELEKGQGPWRIKLALLMDHSDCDGGYTALEVKMISSLLEKLRLRIDSRKEPAKANADDAYDVEEEVCRKALELCDAFKKSADNDWDMMFT